MAEEFGTGIGGSEPVSGASPGASEASSGGGYSPSENSSHGSQQSYSGGNGGQSGASVLEAFRSQGYPVDGFRDDASFLKTLSGRLSEAEQYKQQVEQYQRQIAAQGQGSQFQLQQIQERLAATPEAPEASQPGWNPPAYDTQYDGLFRWDDQQKMFVPSQPNVPYELVQQKNSYHQYRVQFRENFNNNPVETMWKMQQPMVEQAINERLKNLFEQIQVQRDTNQFLEENKKLLWADGQIDHTGDPSKLTPVGHFALEAADELDKMGITDPAARRDYTKKHIGYKLSEAYWSGKGLPQQQQAPQAPQYMPQMDPQYQYPQQYGYPGMMPQQQMPQGYYPQQTYQQPPMQMAPQPSPEQVNQNQKRRWIAGGGHSASAASPSSGPSGEFVPQSPPGGRPNFLSLMQQTAAAQGIYQ